MSRPLPSTFAFPAHALVKEEVVLGGTVGQGAVAVADRHFEGEQHWLAGVGGCRRFAFTNQRSQRATEVASYGAGHVGRGWPLICIIEQKDKHKQHERTFDFIMRMPPDKTKTVANLMYQHAVAGSRTS